MPDRSGPAEEGSNPRSDLATTPNLQPSPLPDTIGTSLTVGVAQLVERRIVVPVAEGSNPSTHPIPTICTHLGGQGSEVLPTPLRSLVGFQMLGGVDQPILGAPPAFVYALDFGLPRAPILDLHKEPS